MEKNNQKSNQTIIAGTVISIVGMLLCFVNFPLGILVLLGGITIFVIGRLSGGGD
jgi:hypothetical protein